MLHLIETVSRTLLSVFERGQVWAVVCTLPSRVLQEGTAFRGVNLLVPMQNVFVLGQPGLLRLHNRLCEFTFLAVAAPVKALDSARHRALRGCRQSLIFAIFKQAALRLSSFRFVVGKKRLLSCDS